MKTLILCLLIPAVSALAQPVVRNSSTTNKFPIAWSLRSNDSYNTGTNHLLVSSGFMVTDGGLQISLDYNPATGQAMPLLASNLNGFQDSIAIGQPPGWQSPTQYLHDSFTMGDEIAPMALQWADSVGIGWGALQFSTNVLRCVAIGTSAGPATFDSSFQLNDYDSFYFGAFAAQGIPNNTSNNVIIGSQALTSSAGGGFVNGYSNIVLGAFCGGIWSSASHNMASFADTISISNWTAGVLTAGSVGIGVASPGAKLDINGNIFVEATTNQVIFGATNTAPASTASPTKWISVRVTGESTVYRLPLYQ